jgi:hypothetical protein
VKNEMHCSARDLGNDWTIRLTPIGATGRFVQ